MSQIPLLPHFIFTYQTALELQTARHSKRRRDVCSVQGENRQASIPIVVFNYRRRRDDAGYGGGGAWRYLFIFLSDTPLLNNWKANINNTKKITTYYQFKIRIE